MKETSLFQDIIKTDTLFFRSIKIGDSIDLVNEIEGPPNEIKEYSNPFCKYFFEIGEMEELVVYYGYRLEERKVEEITVHLTHYPDYYWKNAGGIDEIEFWNFLINNQLQPFSEIFTNTVNQIITHFERILNLAPTLSNENSGPFNQPQNEYKNYQWLVNGQYYFSVTTYIDDKDEKNVKNTMIIKLRKAND